MKSLTALIVLALIGLLCLLVLPACSSSDSAAISSALNTAINSTASAIATSVENGSASQAVSALASSGAIDSSTASEIQAILPVAGAVASALSSATETDSASKHLQERQAWDRAAFEAKVAEILKRHASSLDAIALQKGAKGLKK